MTAIDVHERYASPPSDAYLSYLANRARHQRLEEDSLAAIERWVELHDNPWVAVSGGKDSTVLLHLITQVAPHLPVVWFDSGLEYPQTRPYLEGLADAWGLDFHIIPAVPDALSILEASGEWEHGRVKVPNTIMNRVLLEEPGAEAIRRWGKYGFYGLRADESKGRAHALNKNKGIVERHSRNGDLEQAFCAPIWRWSINASRRRNDLHEYCAFHDVPLHPVYEALTKLGVPPQLQRMGILVSGWGLDQGVWAKTFAVAPEMCRIVETRLPMLQQWR